MSFDSFANSNPTDKESKNSLEIITLESIKTIKEWNFPQYCIIPPILRINAFQPTLMMNLGIGVSDTYFKNDIMRWNLGRN
jgi:hypothetical protein